MSPLEAARLIAAVNTVSPYLQELADKATDEALNASDAEVKTLVGCARGTRAALALLQMKKRIAEEAVKEKTWQQEQ